MSLTVEQLKGWIAEQTGVDASLLDREWFDTMMVERLRARGLAPNAASYRELLEQHPDEMQQVVSEVTVPETWFFRYPASFDLLNAYLRKLRQQPIVIPHLRMLSVACATGEEPISMAMTAVQAGWPLHAIRIDAVDRDARHLRRARENCFGKRSLRDELPSWTERWMHRDGSGISVDPEIVASIQWNLADVTAVTNPLSGRYHVVFCRNLLVYLNLHARHALKARLVKWLYPEGLLFAGHADALDLLRDAFQPISDLGAFAFHARTDPVTCQLRGDQPAELPRAPRFQQRASWRSKATDTPDEVGMLRDARLRKADDNASVNEHTLVPSHSLQDAINLADRGQLEEALGICEALQPSTNSELFALTGSILLALDRCPAARDAFRKSIYLNPANAEALLQLAIVEDRLGDEIQAQRYRRRAAELHQQEEQDQ